MVKLPPKRNPTTTYLSVDQKGAKAELTSKLNRHYKLKKNPPKNRVKSSLESRAKSKYYEARVKTGVETSFMGPRKPVLRNTKVKPKGGGW